MVIHIVRFLDNADGFCLTGHLQQTVPFDTHLESYTLLFFLLFARVRAAHPVQLLSISPVTVLQLETSSDILCERFSFFGHALLS